MPTRVDFQKMASERLDAAEALYRAKHYNESNYLAGYAAEFALKATICKTLDVEVFDEREVSDRISKPLKIHDLPTLLVYAGLFQKIEVERSVDGELDSAWSIVTGWKEDRRYEAQPTSPQTARRFLNAVAYFLTWIRMHW